MKNIVVIGDVSWAGKYHLGDEAMTEVAIMELLNRGANVTLMAGDPAIAESRYKVRAVKRFGYRELVQRAERIRDYRLSRLALATRWDYHMM